MNNLKYPHLFEPIKLAGTLFRNRIFASPTGYQYLDLSGTVPPEAAYYYERKAIGGAASVAVGECVVDSEYGKGSTYHISLDNPHALHGLCLLTDAVTRSGAVAAAELTHAGIYANRFQEPPGTAYGPVDFDRDGVKALQMTEEIIEQTIAKYANAALFAKRCGFGMITVHGGHGWLISQFLSPSLNTRKDKWGGAPIENRARFAVAVLDAIRKAVGPSFPIEIRISGSECYSGGYGIEEGIAFAKQLDGHADLIHVSAGSHEVEEVFTVTHPSMFLEDGCNVTYAAEIRKHIKTPVATVGALCEPEMMEEIISSGKADVVELARALLADPDIPQKARAGKDDDIRKCMRCLSCFSTLMNKGQFYCSINPECGRELEMKFETPPSQKKKVLIAGGGIAGMQAALTCAQRGHEVILCEKSGCLGGALKCEEKVPFKQRLDAYINRQENLIRQSGVEVRLNIDVTAEYASSVGADVIIAALGARPVVPKIPGIEGSNVISAEDAFVHPDKAGNNVVVLGAGLVGVELAIYLSMLGKKVSIVEMLDKINDGGNFQHTRGLMVEINRYCIDLNLSTQAVEINEKGVLCKSGDNEKFFNADTMIYAVGQRSLHEQAISLHGCSPVFHQIGDCVAPSNIMSATAAAHTIARNI